MNFLLINQFFAPDAAPTGQLLAHVARALAAEGHAVRVVCARSRYAEAGGVVARDLAAAADPAAPCTPVSATGRASAAGGLPPELAGMTVYRVRCAGFGRGHAARLASYASFFAGVLRAALGGPRPDVVLTLTTPPLVSLAGTAAKTLRGARHFIWEMDVYPDVAVALSVFRAGSLVERAVGALADFSRRRADGVIALGACMKRRLAARGIAPERLVVAENWADGSVFEPRPFPPARPLCVLYSGNLGLAHEVETAAAAMESLDDATRFRFVFAGGGSRRAALEARCAARGVSNAAFLGYEEEAGLARRFGDCHVGLVTQNPATCGALVPSKTYAFLAAGRPFIFVGPEEATPARILARHGCGWLVRPGDAAGFVKLLNFLADSPGAVEAAGGRARRAFLDAYDRSAGVSRIVGLLTATRDLAPAGLPPVFDSPR